MRFVAQLMLVVAITGLLGCGGTGQPLPTGNQTPETPIQYAPEFPGSLPQDGVQPWEELGSDGRVISATSGATEFFAGTQTDSESGDTSHWNGALRMASGDSGAGNLSYAIYRIPLGGSEPGVVSVDANLRPMNDGNLGGYYVGLADYGNNAWQWFGPVTDAHWRISSVQAAREAARYTSGIGNVFVCVVAHDGAAMDVIGVGVDPLDPADSTAPDAPPAPTLTPVAGGLLVDWTAFAGSDIAGYKVYFKDSAYSELTAFSANTLGTLHDSLLRLSLDEYTPRTWWVAVSTVDLSGNESSISPVVSATPLASAGSQPPVWIELDNATALINQPIGMTVTGADTYDWDTNGDGVFDVLGDATGSQNIDTSSPGIIRPLVRGKSNGGSFVALGAVSVIVTSNARPVVQGFVDPAFGVAPLEVQFTSTQVDIDGTITEYIWDFTSDGGVNFRFSTAGGATDPAPYTFTTPGLYNAKVRAWDDDGAWDVDTVTILVNSGPDPNDPTANLTATPPDCNKGGTIRYNASGSIDGNGTIVDYEWDLDEDGTYNETGDEADHRGSEAVQQTYPDPGSYTISVRVTDNDGATDTASITATVHGWSNRLQLGSLDFTGSDSTMAIVNGNPAVCHMNWVTQGIIFVRAQDSDGSAWAGETFVGIGGNPSLCVVDGMPAVCGAEYFVRATDEDGANWGTPIMFDSTGISTDSPSMCIVNGNPAISYYDWDNKNLMYVRATSADGSSWGTPQVLDSAGETGRYSSLCVVEGNPAISYYDLTNGNLKFARANDANGSTWGIIQHIDITDDVGMYPSLCIIAGHPAISYHDDTNSTIEFIRALTPYGGSWGTPQTIGFSGGGRSTLVSVDGYPSVSYNDRYIRAFSPDGSIWDTPQTVDSGPDLTMCLIDGKPAISFGYWTGSINTLGFVRLY